MTDPGIEFLKNTAYPDFSTVDMILRVPEPPAERPVPEGAEVIPLPDPATIERPDASVRESLEHWEPIEYFSRTSISLEDLSYLLWCIQGVRRIPVRGIEIRNVPSSGRRHPVDTYFLAGEIEGLATGLYRYLPGSHSIVKIREDSDLPFALGTASMNVKVVTRAAVTFLWVAVPYRSVWALGNRGYRSAFIETGHICQALIMAASTLGCSVLPIDLFHDRMMIELVDLDPGTEWPLYVAAVGKQERDL